MRQPEVAVPFSAWLSTEVMALQESVVLPHVAAAGADATAASLQVQAWKGGVPSANCISGMATYTLPSGEPRTASFQVSLLQCCSVIQ